MPERIAVYKLRGFVQDVCGEVIESVPGRVRVRLGGPGSIYQSGGGPLSWLGLGRPPGLIEMELDLEPMDTGRENFLHITVTMRPGHRCRADAEWRARCDRIYCDLRGYLMGQTGSVSDMASVIP